MSDNTTTNDKSRAVQGWHNVVGATADELRQAEVDALVRYWDIIDLPAPTSKKHPRQPPEVRAAQFSPFAALVGYGDEVRETARITQPRRELAADEKASIDHALQQVAQLTDSGHNPQALVTYFVADKHKDGGQYVNVKNQIARIDRYRRVLMLTDGTEIPIDNIASLTLD